MPVTVHLGAHKTATTHLQESLRLAASVLRDSGVYYVGPGELRGELLPVTPGINDSGRLPQRQRARRRLVTAGEVYPEILISDENIIGGTKRHRLFGKAGRIYPDAGLRLARLMSILRNQPVTAALSVRDPVAFNL
ncbi:hypothetical protein PE067_06715, partial [Paracoccus sp. DMF-8]|nr:hypothetical protein [Paracoccus sp. DMF-8]